MTAAIPTRVGGRYPAHCTGVGKAILAFSGEQALAAHGDDLLPRKTKYSIATQVQLHAELNKVRAHGIGCDREESLPGFGCVAAPIGNPGEAVGAVSVCGPMNRMMFDQRLAAPVRIAALRIWRHVEDGVKVAPTLQQMRPLHRGPMLRADDRATVSAGLQYA
jgi:DNA-binding IclR family transcriptional regulator